jgi:hypothetical protein
MTAGPSIDPAQFLTEQLDQASPDLMRTCSPRSSPRCCARRPRPCAAPAGINLVHHPAESNDQNLWMGLGLVT